jgi:uncharacterized protein YdcH (DUF465 family)
MGAPFITERIRPATLADAAGVAAIYDPQVAHGTASFETGRHVRLEHELAAEQARRLPDQTRIVRLKKLKLAVKDRLLIMAQRKRRTDLPQPA